MQRLSGRIRRRTAAPPAGTVPHLPRDGLRPLAWRLQLARVDAAIGAHDAGTRLQPFSATLVEKDASEAFSSAFRQTTRCAFCDRENDENANVNNAGIAGLSLARPASNNSSRIGRSGVEKVLIKRRTSLPSPREKSGSMPTAPYARGRHAIASTSRADQCLEPRHRNAHRNPGDMVFVEAMHRRV